MIGAGVTDGDLETILLIIGVACLAGAGYCAYLQRAMACALLLVVALAAFVLAW